MKSTGDLVSYRVYRGADCIQVFLLDCLKIAEKVLEIYKINVPLQMTQRDEETFQSEEKCHICSKEFLLNSELKCRDHDHLTGRYRGASHQSCNLHYQHKEILPVVMHNFRGYDHHLIIKGLDKMKAKNITVIPTNSEKYMSVSIGSLRFIDSLQFMNCSLAELVNNLKNMKGNGFRILKEVFGKEKYNLLTRKGVYPYDYISCWTKFDESTLPPKAEFYNTLTTSHISAEDYDYATHVFDTFGLTNLGEYHDLYLLTDALLLACVFEEFRLKAMKDFRLDPAYYYSLPGLAWDAALKMTGIELELINDMDIYIFLERGMRGGVSQISHRYAKARNKYMSSYRGHTEDSNQQYIVSWDMVNLYGKAMQGMLPIGNFMFLEQGLIDIFDIRTIDPEDEIGFILEVDISYPEYLHTSHQCYPLVCEKTTISSDKFSSLQQKLLLHLPIKYMDHQEKLVPHFFPRKNYICLASNLKFYVEKGLQIEKIHKILAFKQKRWLQPYVDFNSLKRRNAQNDFDRMFYKLCVNAVFGKGMESVRKRMNVRVVNERKTAEKLIARGGFLSHDILGKNLACFTMQKPTVTLNKAIYTGFTILELSKLHMYKFHYNYVKAKWGERSKLLMTDTDSLAYLISTNDVYEDIKGDLEWSDTSNLPKEHPLFSTKNAGVTGKMKDDAKGRILTKFVGLSPKSYCFVGEDEDSEFKKEFHIRVKTSQ